MKLQRVPIRSPILHVPSLPMIDTLARMEQLLQPISIHCHSDIMKSPSQMGGVTLGVLYANDLDKVILIHSHYFSDKHRRFTAASICFYLSLTPLRQQTEYSQNSVITKLQLKWAKFSKRQSTRKVTWIQNTYTNAHSLYSFQTEKYLFPLPIEWLREKKICPL